MSPTRSASSDPTPTPLPETVETEQETTGPADLLFMAPTETPSPSPELTSSSPDDSLASALPGDASPSAPRSTGKPSKKELKLVTRRAVKTAGGLAHQVLTGPDTVYRQEGLWLPDTEDVEGMADPLASLASRRLPEGAENPDVSDLVRLGLAVLGYVMKQRIRRAELDQIHAQPLAHEPDEDEPAA